ncbi:uncharacterized protein LOC127722133 [Mytilus californianus]|uniref:uncharacterized protein LOC127722133 n=1 Tax=Mytilus californianus TaxID=6549 RepID=UPI002245F831|nr:uncharacterized protein LOC127722133 [Mytilus californianus]
MSKNRPNSRIEGRVPHEDEALAQSLGDIELDLPIDSDKAREVHATDHIDKLINDTSDHGTIFGLNIKHELRIPSKRAGKVHSTDYDETVILKTVDNGIKFGTEIKYGVRPSKRVRVPLLDEGWESLGISGLDVPIDHGKEVNKISVASITDNNMHMRPWPVVIVPPPPPDPPNPN